MLLYVACALTVFGMAGLALDLGRVYVTKTRLQNAVDAAALDGAKTIQNGGSTANVTTNATSTFTTNVTGINIPSGALTIETSSTQSPFVAGSLPATFVKVTATSIPVTTYLINVFRGTTTMPITTSAMAGPQGGSDEICGAIPLALCGTDNGDTDCTDGNGCYGITLEATGEVRLRDSASSPGNYGLVQFGSPGAAQVRLGMAGGANNCFTDGGTINTETGMASGPSQGLNTRFGDTVHPLDPDDYPGDKVTTGGSIAYPVPTTMHSTYETLYATQVFDNVNGQPKRREVLSPIVDCSTLAPGSSAPATVIGSACLFLTREVTTGGAYGNNVFVEFIDTCRASGSGGSGGSGPGQIIVLYQSGTQS